MRKRVILAMLLVVALILTSSCSLIVKDPEVDKQTVIIEVGGKTFTKGEIADQIAYQLDYQEYMYSMYGLPFDKTADTAITEAQTAVVNGLIEQTVVANKTTELKMDEFTAEELTELESAADTSYQSYVDSVKTSYFAETELTGEELDAAIEAKMVELGYPTRDALLESQKSTKATDKLKADVVKDVAVTDDEIKTEYDTRVSEAMTNYVNNPSTYGTAVTGGETIYYTPAGYRYVKNLLVQFVSEDQTKIDDINSQLTDKQSQLTNVQTSLTEMGEDASADTEEDAKQRADLTATQDTLNTEIADLQKQLDAARETAYATIQPKIDEILAKLAEGGDFDALMEEYGEDTGMKSSPAKENGYPVSAASTNWVTEFTDASMALAKIGDVSPAVRTSYGIHLIKYVSDATEGSTPLEDVKDTISSELLTQKQDALYTDTVAEWVTAANAKTYLDRLAD